MSKIKKVLLTIGNLILSIVIVTSLAGCGQNEASNNDNEKVLSQSVDNDLQLENTSESFDYDTANSTFLSIGDNVTFGKYEQDNNDSNGTEPIQWQVADISNDRALLISSYVLDILEYNESAGIYGDDSSQDLPWASSYIYTWLNNDFASTAFSNDEMQLIVDTTDYSKLETEGNVEIIGSVFLLSYEEALKYFELDTATDTDVINKSEYKVNYSDKALCLPTPYAFEEISAQYRTEFTQEDMNRLSELGFNCDQSNVGKTYSSYWLRSSLSWDSWFTAEGHALVIEEDGTLTTDIAGFKNVKTHENGIRPCVWINLDGSENFVSKVN